MSNNEGLQLYLQQAQKHQIRYQQELDELRSDLLAGHFRSRDYRATERILQVFTELCIGLAKHWVKQLQGKSSSEAYQTFTLLTEHGKITSQELAAWKRIIGMRNGLVHDYLNVDLLIVESIIKQQLYLELSAFANKAIAALQNNGERI
ncbi:MAG: type VII toxin-antitoxin system HepT family RNase toxin [Vibrio sp.]|uniref:type VII toxin-antitoxin system HepT family RNase toxin n=1 Tax=Vibrio sp. TaxID=678 RepID=UPI003A881027